MDSNIVTVRRLQRFWDGCKTWIAARFVQQTYHNVTLNADGTVNTSDVISYATVSSRLSSPLYHDYLLVTWGNSMFLAKAVEGIANSVQPEGKRKNDMVRPSFGEQGPHFIFQSSFIP